MQQVTGTNGECSLPSTATAVALNVTALDGTAPSFLTLYPGGTPPTDSQSVVVGGSTNSAGMNDVTIGGDNIRCDAEDASFCGEGDYELAD